MASARAAPGVAPSATETGASIDARSWEALRWIARLPLLAEPDLALLLGAGAAETHHLSRELADQGWVETLVSEDPALAPAGRLVMRPEAVPALAARLGVSTQRLRRALPLGEGASLRRAAAIGRTAGANRTIAALAGALSTDKHVELADARSLPLAVPAGGTLAGMHIYGCLRSGAGWAPFLLCWDMQATPDAQRRAWLRRWHARPASVDEAWGGLPPLLLVTENRATARAWVRVTDELDTPPELLLTDAGALTPGRIGEARWWQPQAARWRVLLEELGWGERPPLPVPSAELHAGPDPPPRGGPGLEGRLRSSVARRQGRASPRMVAAALPAVQLTALAEVGRHPLISAAELGAVHEVASAGMERRLEELQTLGLVHGDAEYCGQPLRFVLSGRGVRVLASASGIRSQILETQAGLVVGKEVSALKRLVPMARHSCGVNRVVAGLARGAREQGWRIMDWPSSAQAQFYVEPAEGAAFVLRPDALVRIGRRARTGEDGREERTLLVEYERGTGRRGIYRQKGANYGAFYAHEAWRGRASAPPALLFVCTDVTTEKRIIRAAREWPPLPLLVTTEENVDAGTEGPWGAVWWTEDRVPRRRLISSAAT